MRKRKKGRKFGRIKDQRKAFLKALASALILRGRIKTTEARAKELRPFIEKWITKAKQDTISRKRLAARLFSPKIVKKLFETGSVYKERRGGYTRIIKLGRRKLDGAKMAIIELVK